MMQAYFKGMEKYYHQKLNQGLIEELLNDEEIFESTIKQFLIFL